MEQDYCSLENEVKTILGDHKVMVLATCSDDRVTARSVSCILKGLSIFFQTDKSFTKYDQILKNPRVALCFNNVQIEGKAMIKGHPFDEKNSYFLGQFQKYFNSSYQKYSCLENEVVIEVEPALITLWKYDGGRPLRDFLDVKGKMANREYYQ